MAATFVPDPTQHGLSAEAQALDPARLTNEILVAEEVLELTTIPAVGDDLERGKVAVARQVNLQVLVARDPDIVSEGRGRQNVRYATVNGVRVVVDPTAWLLAQRVRKAGGVLSRLRSGTARHLTAW